MGLLAGILGGSVSVPAPVAGQNVKRTVRYFKDASVAFGHTTDELFACLQALDSTRPSTAKDARAALIKCRLRYKDISFFLDYFFPQTAWFYNAPAKYEVEEPFMEYEEPHGLQQIEALLCLTNPVLFKTALIEQATVIRESARVLPELSYRFAASDAQLLESLHIELIRIMTLYITGYDAPYLKSGISESVRSLDAIGYVISGYSDQDPAGSRSLKEALQKALLYLKKNTGFDRFDRLTFLSGYALPLEDALQAFIRGKGLQICTAANLNYSAKNLFQHEVRAPGSAPGKDLIRLGKMLFFEKRLSGNDSRSCASCHQPENYFTDGLRRNKTFDQRATLKRNTPTVLYAAAQSAQFWDGRVKSLEEQIKDVLANPKEMNAMIPSVEREINGDVHYRALFTNAFQSGDTAITIDQISIALADYLKSLMPMNSPFDRYLRGEKQAMTTLQKKGFNLFMGKAQCGTCHFIPYFNGSTPPLFNRSEYEALGVPVTGRLDQPRADTDAGRFSIFPSPYYRGAFKTPTLRNIEKTAPYMHNGAFGTLSVVIEFYNRGGGAGLGMHTQHQTLSDQPLHLAPEEKKAIILFLNSLTDKL